MAWTREDISVRILDTHDDEIRAAVAARFPDIRFVDRAQGAAGLKVFLGFCPPEDEPLEGYDWVHAAGAGVDHHCKALEGVTHPPVITRTTGRMGEQIGEYCIAYALEHLQKVRVREALRVQRVWDKQRALPVQLFDSHVAILGTGAIGAGIARAFKQLGAASVSGYSRSGASRAPFDAVHSFDDLTGLSEAGIVILALPGTPETKGIVDAGVLAQMDNALLINVGRGSTLDPDVLKDALAARQVYRAVLDVFETEPLPDNDWRWRHTCVTVTPHISGVTRTQDTVERFCALMDAYLQTGEPPASINVARGY